MTTQRPFARLWLLYAFGLTLLLAGIASAQAVSGSIAMNWTLPTTGCTPGVTPCDNVPLTGAAALTSVEVFVSTSPILDTSTMTPTLTLGPGVTTGTTTMQVTNGATLYSRIKARNPVGASPFSNQLSKVVSVPITPGVPTNVSISITITP